MSITAPGYYGLTLEKQLIDTAGESMEAEDNKVLLMEDGYTPNFDTHDFRNDVTNEVTGTNYTAGGIAFTGTEITLASGVLTWDCADPVFSTITVSNIMGAAYYFNVGSSATDQLIMLQDFVTAINVVAGNFTIQENASGLLTLDYTP